MVGCWRRVTGIGVILQALAGLTMLSGPLTSARAAAPSTDTLHTCTYHVVHVETRLRVRADAYVGAPVIGYLYPGQHARGGCRPMWGVDRYWVRLIEPHAGYAAAYYLSSSGSPETG